MGAGARRAALGAVVALAAGSVALAVTAWLAADHLAQARSGTAELRDAVEDGDLAAARTELAAVQQHTRSARRLTSWPGWDVMSLVPPAARVSQLAAAADDVAGGVVPPLLDAANKLRPEAVRREPDRLDLAALRAALPDLELAGARLADVDVRLRPTASTGVRPLDEASRELADDVERLRGAVDSATDVVRVLPGMLGADGPRRWFVAFQTGAESRGTGGLVGAFGVLTADAGRLTFTTLGDDRRLHGLPPPRTDEGPDYRSFYGPHPDLWANTNLSPHFPYAAARWIDMWQQGTGEQLDGALATDPVALASVLSVTGPVRLADGTEVAEHDVVRLVGEDAYARFDDDQSGRKDYLVALAAAVVDRLLHGPDVDARALAGELRHVVADRRLLAYSTRPQEQTVLAGTPLAGEVPDAPGPFAAVVVNNAAANKLDQYLERDVSYSVGRCTGDRRTSVLRARLTNAVPDRELPGYVLGGIVGGAPGTSRLNVAVYAARGAALSAAFLDGERVAVTVHRERGHPVFALALDLPPRAPRELVVHLVEPPVPAAPELLVQPLVLPQHSTVEDAGCPAA